MEGFNVAGSTTLPHELGHAFGLYHTFQNGCVGGDCWATGDYVCDTDPHSQTSGCPTDNNSCTNTSWEPVVRNIMNYSSCPDRLTEGQKERMMASLFYFREELIRSHGATAIGDEVEYLPPIASTCTNIIANQEPNNWYNMGPANVFVGDFAYSSGGYTADGNQEYIDHTELSWVVAQLPPIVLTKDQTYPIEVTTLLNRQNVRVWIDFNNDGSFDVSELVLSSDGTVDGDASHTGSFTVPSSAVRGVQLRMRVFADWNLNTTLDTCGTSLLYGQIEDFMVTVIDPLPVHLSDISAKAQEKSIYVLWTSASEKDLAYYEVERSIDGKSFAGIGKVEAKAVAPSQYRLLDEYPVFNVMNHYRLRMVDRDGTSTFSKVVSASVRKQDALSLELFPNPAKEYVRLSINTEGAFRLTVVNTFGEIVYSKIVRFELGSSETIDLSGHQFASGVYSVLLRADGKPTASGRFVLRK